MQILTKKTCLIQSDENLFSIIDAFYPDIQEKDVLVITSKIISICEKRVVPIESIEKELLIRQEADAVCEKSSGKLALTLKNHMIIPAAGIDESNSETGGYILYPEDVWASCEKIWTYLRETRGLQQVGVIITDSHTTPLRRGVQGIGLAWCGFSPTYSYVGKPDLFQRPLKITVTNVVDSLAVAAVLVMGEGDECTPFALIREAPKVVFSKAPPTKQEIAYFYVPVREDIYAPILNSVSWIYSKTRLEY